MMLKPRKERPATIDQPEAMVEWLSSEVERLTAERDGKLGAGGDAYWIKRLSLAKAANERLTTERDRLRAALEKIENPDFPGVIDTVMRGEWKNLAEELSEIARTALEQCPRNDEKPAK